MKSFLKTLATDIRIMKQILKKKKTFLYKANEKTSAAKKY